MTESHLPQIFEKLGEIAGTQQAMLHSLGESKRRLDDHGSRLSDIEKILANYKGKIAIITIIGGALWAAVMKFGGVLFM